MKRLRGFKAGKGKTPGRVYLTLKNADGVFQAWLSPGQAEQLARDLFMCRFDFPDLVTVNPPPKWQKPPKEVFLSFSTTMPRRRWNLGNGLKDLPSGPFLAW